MPIKCIPQSAVELLKEKVEKGQITPDDVAKMLPEERTALKAILEDFVSEKLGVKIKPEEIKEISVRAKVIDEAQKKLGVDLGNPSKVAENIDFFKAKKSMDDYLRGRAPASKLKVLTGTIGRGMMLFSAKSPLLNVGSNIEVGFTEALSRRLASGQIKGADNALAIDFVKMANKIYQKTGYDISRMTSLSDLGSSGERVLGDTVHAQGKGGVRKVGRIVEDIVFKQLMGAPDVAFSSAHFADSVNLNSLKMAEGNKAKAREWMNDAMRLEPQTPEGEILKAQGVLDAQKATWTDASWASKVSMGIRKILNDVSGDARVGDYVFPFVKTPANVIATGMDYAGMGIPKALVETYKAYKTGELGSKQYRQSVARNLVRSGLGLVGALMIASQLKDDDFVGAYDPGRAQIESLRNSNYNAIRIGGKWISTDWLGPLAVPVTAMMYARKYGSTPGERTFQYSKGVLNAIYDLPGISDAYDYIKSTAYSKNQTLEEMVGSTRDYILNQGYSRLVPSFLSDTAKATDQYERKAKGALNVIKSKIPFLRKTLPIKKNVFGEDIKDEGAATNILFGSRVKTDKEDKLVHEINTVANDNDKSINFTDWDKSSSKTLGQFKEKVGTEEYDKAKVTYGQELKRLLEEEIAKGTYHDLSNEDKLKKLNGLDAKAMDVVFKKYGFKYKAKK